MSKFLPVLIGATVGAMGTLVGFYILYVVLFTNYYQQPAEEYNSPWRTDESGMTIAPRITLEPKP